MLKAFRATRRSTRRRACALLASAALALAGTARLAAQTPAPAAAPAPANAPALDKDMARELAKGKLIDTIEARKKAKPAYVPPETLIKPFASASVSPPVAYELAEGREFASAAQAQQLCQSIVDQLLAAWTGPKPDVKVFITAEDYYHGEAEPSGLMLISLGTFNSDPALGATTVEELSLLIAHELSHLLLGHVGGNKVVNVLINGVSLMTNSYLAYSQVSNTHMTGQTLTIAGDTQTYRQALISQLASETVIHDILSPSFGRGKELEADRLGIDLARRAGFDITERIVSDFIGHHTADDARITARMQALGLLLHLLSDRAADKIAARMTQQTGGLFGDLARKAAAAASSEVVEQGTKFIAMRNKDHPDPAVRKAFDLQYLAANYPPAPHVEGGRLVKRDLRLSRLADSPEVTTLRTHVAAASKVHAGVVALLDEKDSAKQNSDMQQMMKNSGLSASAAATALAKPAATAAKGKGRKAPPADTAPARPNAGFGDDRASVTWSMDGVLRGGNGNADQARLSWRKGLGTELPSIDLMQRWGRSLPADRRAIELPPMLDRYSNMLGTSDPIMDLVVAAAVTRGDIATAEVTAAQCVTYGNGKLYPSCVAFLGYDPMNKATPAQTEEGKKAFANKSFERNFQLLKNITDIFS